MLVIQTRTLKQMLKLHILEGANKFQTWDNNQNGNSIELDIISNIVFKLNDNIYKGKLIKDSVS